MKGENAFRLLDCIRDDMIIEAETFMSDEKTVSNSKKREHRSWPAAAVAACICVAALTVYMTILAVGNGTFERIFNRPAHGTETVHEDESVHDSDILTETDRQDIRIPDPIVNPYAGMTKQELIDLYNNNKTMNLHNASSFNTPFYYFYLNMTPNSDAIYLIYNKLTGETFDSLSIQDFEGNPTVPNLNIMLTIIVADDRLYYLTWSWPACIFSSALDMSDMREEYKADMNTMSLDMVLVKDGKAYGNKTDFHVKSRTVCIDLATGEVQDLITNDGQPVVNSICAFDHFVFYMGEKQDGLYRYDVDTGESVMCIRCESIGENVSYILPDAFIHADVNDLDSLCMESGRPSEKEGFIRFKIYGDNREDVVWLNLATGEVTKSNGGIVIGDKEIYIRQGLEELHPDDPAYGVFLYKPEYGELWQSSIDGKNAGRMMKIRKDKHLLGIDPRYVNLRNRCQYDGKCLFVPCTDVSDPRDLQVTRMVVIDLTTGTAASGFDHIEVEFD